VNAGPRDEREALVGLSLLISTERAEMVQDLWDHGEPGVALEILASNLSDDHVPLTAARRAELASLARPRGVGDQVEWDLRWCPDPDDEHHPWQVIEGTEAGVGIESELYEGIGPGHLLHGRQLTAWLTCVACDDVLVRLDDEEARAGKVPYACAVVHPTWIGKRDRLPWPYAEIFSSAHEALDTLIGHCE
jgi:hypothetical protein